jgi:hypothetical protein
MARRPRFTRDVFHAVVILLAAGAANATVRHVPGDYPTIQAAIDASTIGDEVLVDPGTYVENVSIGPAADGIRLASTGGPGVTTIEGYHIPNEPPSSVTPVTLYDVGASTVVEGFTVTGGAPSSICCGGSGLVLTSSDAIVRNNIITGNGSGSGGGIHIVGGAPTIMGNTISHNSSISGAGGVSCNGDTHARFVQDVICDNGGPIGGGIGLEGSEQVIECTIVGNKSAVGTGIYVCCGSPTVSRTIVAFNLQVVSVVYSGAGSGIEVSNGASISITCSDAFGNSPSNYAGMPDPTGTNGNQSTDPVFCDLSSRDLTISTFSPCSPAHSPSGCDLVGALPPVCATVPAVRSTWGQLKARYR